MADPIYAIGQRNINSVIDVITMHIAAYKPNDIDSKYHIACVRSLLGKVRKVSRYWPYWIRCTHDRQLELVEFIAKTDKFLFKNS